MVAGRIEDPADRIVLSVRRTRRDLRISGILTIVGALLYVVFVVSRAAFAGSTTTALVALILGSVGSLFLFVGLIFVGVNWWLLRNRERT